MYIYFRTISNDLLKMNVCSFKNCFNYKGKNPNEEFFYFPRSNPKRQVLPTGITHSFLIIKIKN